MTPKPYLGCGDGGCVIEKPRGMHANGGCLCLRGMDNGKRVKLRRALDRDRKRIAELEARLAEMSGDRDDDAWTSVDHDVFADYDPDGPLEASE